MHRADGPTFYLEQIAVLVGARASTEFLKARAMPLAGISAFSPAAPSSVLPTERKCGAVTRAVAAIAGAGRLRDWKQALVLLVCRRIILLTGRVALGSTRVRLLLSRCVVLRCAGLCLFLSRRIL